MQKLGGHRMHCPFFGALVLHQMMGVEAKGNNESENLRTRVESGKEKTFP